MATPETNQVAPEDKKDNSKEYNFRMLEQRAKEAERRAQEAESRAEEALKQSRKPIIEDEEDDDGEPYVDKKRLAKKFNSFEKTMDQQIEKKAEQIARSMIQKEKKDNWIKNNPDFEEILYTHAQQFQLNDPEFAETIMAIPDAFERQKLVYKNIKALGLHKPKETIQQKVDAKQSPGFYQPSGMGAAPYTNQADFSLKGQMESYKKMQELKGRISG